MSRLFPSLDGLMDGVEKFCVESALSTGRNTRSLSATVSVRFRCCRFCVGAYAGLVRPHEAVFCSCVAERLDIIIL